MGLDFLPRGGGVVTRRPLELRLVHLNTQEPPVDWKAVKGNGLGEKCLEEVVDQC